METAKTEYQKRCSEIDQYFDLLKFIDQIQGNISGKDISNNEIIFTFDVNVLKVLKANVLLLLYNLIESSVRLSINAILNDLNRNNLKYETLNEKLRKIWIYQVTYELKSGTFDIDRIRTFIEHTLDTVLRNELVYLETGKCINISGNVDAQQIRSIADYFGFNRTSNGHQLLEIKTKRNKLAHGENTFSDVGAEYSIRDLDLLKIETYQYLNSVLVQVESYIKDRKHIL